VSLKMLRDAPVCPACGIDESKLSLMQYECGCKGLRKFCVLLLYVKLTSC
jgi:hypothetical protein